MYGALYKLYYLRVVMKTPYMQLSMRINLQKVIQITKIELWDVLQVGRRSGRRERDYGAGLLQADRLGQVVP